VCIAKRTEADTTLCSCRCRFKPAGSLRGMPRNLRLMVFLDTTRNTVAIKEAYHRNIPTIAMVNTTKDLSMITYPVLARDFRSVQLVVQQLTR
jgi:ribosomal protein S2